MESSILQKSLVHCRTFARQHAATLYFSCFALPREKKDAAFAIYAFCRYAVDLVEETSKTDGIEASLAQLSSAFDEMLSENAEDPPFAPAFAWAVKKYGVERALFLDLMRGMRGDLGCVRIKTWPDLREYCYFVASALALIMARIFGLTDPRGRDHAIDLGLAIQLTNICRDVGTDLDRDRIYLPACELERFGVNEEDLFARRITPEFKDLMRHQVHRARVHYLRAEHGIRLLHDDGSQLTGWIAREMNAAILDEIEKADYDVLTRRVTTSRWRKLCLAGYAWNKYRKSKSQTP